MRHWIWGILCMLVSCQPASTDLKQTNAIDRELEQLQAQLQDYRIRELNAEVSSEYQMRAMPGAFTQGLKQAEKDQIEAERIEKRIQDLLEQKRKLLNGPNGQ